MNLKDRLNIIGNVELANETEYQNLNDIQIKDESFVSDIFVRNDYVERIIKNAVLSSENIIFASGIDCENEIIAQYLKTFIPDDKSVEIVYNNTEEIKHTKAEHIICPETDINDFVKILEFILYGYKKFILGLNLKSYDNFIDSIKTLILLNYPNLTEACVSNLIGSTEAVVIFVSKNADGLFVVSNIGEIVYRNNNLTLEDLYSLEEKENIQIFQEEKSESETKDFEIYESDLTEEEIQPKETSENDSLVDEINVVPVKVNKYRLLKEKIKSKKQ